MAVPGIAGGHPDHGNQDASQELFAGEGVAGDKQHSGDSGHLPARQENVTLIGKGSVNHPGGLTGRVADVYAHGDFAYLTAFREPDCDNTGVHVMDISDLSDPVEVTEAFMPTSPGSYAGEGIQVIEIGDRDVLIHQNETCPGATPPAGTSGGINLWDVTDPLAPQVLAMHAGDYDTATGAARLSANTVHSMWAWRSTGDKRTYVAMVDNVEFTDVDIMDITDPENPVMVNDTLDLVDLFGVDQESPETLTSVFNHDMIVYKVGQRDVMLVNYWDGGYVILDVTDPTPGNVTLIAESDYAELDEERLKRGHEVAPEGNAHQSELSPNKKFLIGTDEDFNPYRVTATIDSGPHAGAQYVATSASGTPPISSDTTVTGDTTFVGLACDPVPAGEGTALVERGDCAFQQKLGNIAAAGYSAGIVFNLAGDGCQARVTMLAEGDIPFLFVGRLAGLQLLGVEGVDESNACSTESPPAASPSEATTIQAEFDGWGYVRLFGVDIPKSGAGSISQIDTYAIEESQDEAFATGFGDLSVHEVAMDPRGGLAYLSYYAGGLRVLEYGKRGLREVGVFIDEGGNNFWGVEAYERDGEHYVLASDRDFGLYVFQYDG